MLESVSETNELEKHLIELCLLIVNKQDLELYDWEYFSHNSLLRLYIQRPGTKTADLDDCSRVDRSLSTPFEEADWVPEGILLEVSSPGVYRRLRTLKQFEAAVGQRIAFQVQGDKDPESGYCGGSHKGKLFGILELVDPEGLFFEVNIEDTLYKFSFDKLKKANVEPNWADLQKE